MSTVFLESWIAVGVRVAMAGRADEYRVRQRNLAALTTVLLLVHVARLLDDWACAEFTKAVRANKQAMSNRAHSKTVIHLHDDVIQVDAA